MTFSQRARHGARAAIAVGTFTSLLMLGSLAEASAATNATPGSISAGTATIRHPDLDWAGSQFAAHEPLTPGRMLAAPEVAGTPGLDVSSYQGNVNWSAAAGDGAKFAYVKATESTDYTNPYFTQQYDGSYNVGIIRGAYHFATPDTSSGATQADYFVNHGGGWSGDGRTLPGMIDLEWNPYGSACYGLSAGGMVDWILSFSNEYHARTSRWPVIYTAMSWWSECTGDVGDFSSTNPLMLACYCDGPGTMPYNWPYETIWQYASSGVFPGDQDTFNGDYSRVQALANG